MTFYWNEDDKKDQEFRRRINTQTIYIDNGRCDLCGDQSVSECTKCRRLLCELHTCIDGYCPEHAIATENGSLEN
jgi:hypothetical protein